MIKVHAQAVLDLLNAQAVPFPLTVFDGVVPAAIEPKTTPYVVVRFSEGPPRLNFRGVTHEYLLRINCYCVAGSESATRTIVDGVTAALLDVTPVVTGRKCYPIRWVDSAEQDANERTGSVVSMMIIGYELRSVPSS